MLIDVNKWIDKNGSFDEAGGLDLVRMSVESYKRKVGRLMMKCLSLLIRYSVVR